jgi:hypothetical protein
VYDQPAVTGIITEAYAPDPPNGAPPQHPADPDCDPAPQIWNLAQVTPAGTTQVQEDPQRKYPEVSQTLNPVVQPDPVSMKDHNSGLIILLESNVVGAFAAMPLKYVVHCEFKVLIQVVKLLLQVLID